MSGFTVNPESRRLEREDLDGHPMVLRWCATHDEPVWEYADGSQSCRHDLVTESSNDHEVIDGPWEIEP